MTVLGILRLIAAAVTALTGLLLVFWPARFSGFTGLAPDTARGLTEIRAAMGGLFTALGIAPIAFNSLPMYRMLGIGYLAIAVVRIVSMVVDGSIGEQSNWISLAVEVAFGVILII